LVNRNELHGKNMIKIFYLMRRLPHLSLEDFQSYWSEKHPQAAPEDAFSTLGVKRYIQVLPLETEARDLVIGPRTGLVEPLDGIAELWVESIEALETNWSTEKAKEYIKIFFKDEQNFIDWSRSTILVSKENIVMP
jgi:hypothetical protein